MDSENESIAAPPVASEAKLLASCGLVRLMWIMMLATVIFIEYDAWYYYSTMGDEHGIAAEFYGFYRI